MTDPKQLKSFKDLSVWQKALDLTAVLYEVTEKFPDSELYGLTSQMRRAAISISSNLAEGFKRNHIKEKVQFYNIAYGSAAELESQIEVAKKINFLRESDHGRLVGMISEVSKMLEGLIQSVRRNALNSKSYILNSDQRGIAALVTVMTITLFLISVAFLVANVSRSSVAGQANEAHATRAQFLAEAGIQDALIRLSRGSSSPHRFIIAEGSSSVAVAITTGSPAI